MNQQYFEADIPTRRTEMLDKLINSNVAKLIRYSWWLPEISAEQCYLSKQDVFSLTSGPIYIMFDSGIGIGASSHPSLASVQIWLEHSKEITCSDLLSNDSDYYPISADDVLYSVGACGNIIGSKLVRYEIIKQEPYSVRFWNLPREVAVVLYFNNDCHLILSHGIHDNSDDFSVLQWGQVDKCVFKTLYKTSKYWK